MQEMNQIPERWYSTKEMCEYLKNNIEHLQKWQIIDIIREEDWGQGVSRGNAVLDIVKAAAREAKNPDKKSAMMNAALDQYSKGNIITDDQGAFAGLLASKGIETFFD